MFDTKTLTRFWNKVDKRSDGNCWNWKGAKNTKGYGNFRVGSLRNNSRRTVMPHRYSYELHNGSIPDGQVVCHKCDNPSCVNPHHLELGTQLDNIADMYEKGRENNPLLFGESSPNAKLTENQVKEIRRKYATGKFRRHQLANEYGVSIHNISAITSRKTWAHI